MFLQISERGAGILLILALSACGGADNPDRIAADGDNGRQNVTCALSGATEFSENCSIQHVRQDDGGYLLIRHPDGGFRKFILLRDGRGLAAAHGADPTRITIIGDGRIELSSGDDRYRLPAKIKDGSGTP